MARRPFYLLLLLFPGAMPAGDLTPAQKQLNIASFEKVWTTVRDTHWDPKLGGLDWKAVHDDLLPAEEKAETMAEARKAMSDMLARLHQTHFGIIPADAYHEVDDKSPAGGGISEGRTGIDVRVVRGQALVTSVDRGSPAAKAGVRPGWLILQIEGKDVAGSIETVGAAYKDSTLRDMMLSRALASRLSGDVGEKARVQFQDGTGGNPALKIGSAPPRAASAKT